ncbi:MAG: amidohydrolase family protein [Gemmatimonadales bacterium]|nr:amidohydrolase family protein [Gemmatimonadales bacterium]
MTIRRATEHLTILALGLALGCNPGEGKTAYVGAEVFDGTGAPLILNAVIVVDGAHIAAIGPADAVEIPRGAAVVSLDGRWVVPGFVDGHTHVERWALRPFLTWGVTSVRDVGGVLDSVLVLRDETVLGSTLGPRMYIAGSMIDGAPATWPSAIEVRTPTEARQAVDRLTLLDMTMAKLYTRIDRGLMEAILNEAKVLKLPVTAHLGRVDALTAADLGLHGIEHLSGIVEATAADPGRYFAAHTADFFTGWNLAEQSWPQLDSAALARTARRLVERGVYLVPTLVLHDAWAHLSDRSYIEGLDLSGVPAAAREAWDIPDLIRRARLGATEFRALQRARPYQDRFVRMFHRAGGTVVAGTDASNQLLAPGASLHHEMELLVRAGLLPRDALLAATGNAARFLGLDSVGILRAGSVADFVILGANPLQSIANTRQIDRVVYRGTAYSPADLLGRP